MWQLDARALGYTWLWDIVREQMRGRLPTQICFTGDEVVVTFVSRLVPSSIPRRGKSDESLPLRLQAIFIDAKTGKVRTRAEWPTASYLSRITPVTKDRFAVITSEKLLLYSLGGEQLKEMDLPLGSEAIQDWWAVNSSPGGKYLVIEYEPKTDEKRDVGYMHGELRRLWIDADNLHLLGDWTARDMDAGSSLTISDAGVAFDGSKIGRPDGPREWLCLPYNNSKAYCGGYGSLLNNQTIFMTSGPSRDEWMALISTSGEVLMHQDYLHREIFRILAHSADGRRFALALEKGKGGSAAFDIAPHYSLSRIIVYDLGAREWIYTVYPKQQGIRGIEGLALSPDGSLLGLINQDGMVEVYRLSGTS